MKQVLEVVYLDIFIYLFSKTHYVCFLLVYGGECVSCFFLLYFPLSYIAQINGSNGSSVSEMAYLCITQQIVIYDESETMLVGYNFMYM